MQEAHQAQEELAANFAAFVGKVTTLMHVTEWAQEQRKDPTLLAIIEWIQDRKRGKTLQERLEKTTDKDTIAQIMCVHNNLVIKKGKLYRQHTRTAKNPGINLRSILVALHHGSSREDGTRMPML